MSSSSLYAQYISEREGKHIVESDDGFATYYFLADGCYIENLYVRPDSRFSGIASSFADRIAGIAKERGVHKLYGTVIPSTKGSTESLKVLIAYGFRLNSAANNLIVMEMGI